MISKLCGQMRQDVPSHMPSLEEAHAVTDIGQTAAPRTGLIVPRPRQITASGESGLAVVERDRQPVGSVDQEVSQEIASFRRGESAPPSPYDILGPMASPSPENDSASGAAASAGVSAFIARVLDQLMLSAWLPASLLTASLAILLQFRSTKSVNVLNAVRSLTADPLRVLVLVIPALILATVVTQAFSFEAIKTLEGYWHRRGPASWARTLMIRKHVRKKKVIAKRRQEAYEHAFLAVRGQMIDAGISFNVLNAIEAGMHNREAPPLKKSELAQLENVNWRSSCEAWRLAKIDSLINAELTYPSISRILPTRLGNLMRATEDNLHNVDGDVQGFALRRYDLAPQGIQVEHDQFRNRLNMYCILVFVSALLATLTPFLLFGRGITAVAIAVISVGFAALSFASYRAALASASGYCEALRQMDQIPLADKNKEEVA